MVTQGANPNATTSSGLPLLSLAAINGHHQCVDSLVAHEADINGQSKRYRDINPLSSITDQYTELVTLLYTKPFWEELGILNVFKRY